MDWNHTLSTFLGSVPALAIVLGFLWRIDRRITLWFIEHEVLISWWQKEHPDQTLPTRTRRH